MPMGIYKRTKEHNKAISKALKGKIGWSKGLTKETDERILKMSLSLREKRNSPRTEFKKGQTPWNKGIGVYKKCKTCSKKFYTPLARHKDERGKFCSMECRRNYFSKLADEFKLDKNMAELIGIIIGDGCISKYKNKNYRIFISGNKIEDKYYMENYLPYLVKKCLGKKPYLYQGKNGALIVQFHNEAFRLFLKKIGITENKTKSISIPKQIMENPNLLKRCIRGIADTDFTLIFTRNHNYPRITAKFASKNLVKDLEKSLRKMNFTLNTIYDFRQKDNRKNKIGITNNINLDGPHNLKKWLDLIGFVNLRIISRYELWKKEGFLEPKTTLPERLKRIGWVGGDFYEQNYPSD